MTNEQAREIFNAAIASETDSDRIAKVELMREYFCNETFRTVLHDHVWNVKQAQPPARAWGETRATVAPNDEVEFLSPYTGEVSVVSYRGDFNGKAMVWTGMTQYAVDYSAIRRVVNA